MKSIRLGLKLPTKTFLRFYAKCFYQIQRCLENAAVLEQAVFPHYFFCKQ